MGIGTSVRRIGILLIAIVVISGGLGVVWYSTFDDQDSSTNSRNPEFAQSSSSAEVNGSSENQTPTPATNTGGSAANPDSIPNSLNSTVSQLSELNADRSDGLNQDENSQTDTGNQTSSNARPGEVLSEEVYRVISEVQRRFEEGQFEEGLNELNALYAGFEELSDFERATVLNFYTNALLANEMYPEAILAFEQILEVEDLRPDIRLRALKSLGQLNVQQTNYEGAVEYYDEWLIESGERDPDVLLDLANSHYRLNQYSEAVSPLIEHIDILYTQEEEVDRNKLGLLNVLALETNDWESAAWVTEIMVEQYNSVSDWKNLEAIYVELGDEARRAELMTDARAAGLLDDSGNWLEDN